jgi:hypothetical protein
LAGVLAEGALPAVAGIALGRMVAAGLARFITGLLQGVPPLWIG